MNSKTLGAFLDMRMDTNYTEMTVCLRVNFRSFFPEAWNDLFSIRSKELKGFSWQLTIFEPFHSMRDFGKQV